MRFIHVLHTCASCASWTHRWPAGPCFYFVQQLPQLEWIKYRLSFFTEKEANVDVNACSADKYIYSILIYSLGSYSSIRLYSRYGNLFRYGSLFFTWTLFFTSHELSSFHMHSSSHLTFQDSILHLDSILHMDSFLHLHSILHLDLFLTWTVMIRSIHHTAG